MRHYLIFTVLFLNFAMGCAHRRIDPAEAARMEKNEKPTEKAASAAQSGDVKFETLNAAQIDAQDWRERASNAEYHFSMGQAYSMSGETDRAIEEYKIALMYDPDSSVVLTKLAAEWVRKGELNRALEFAKRAVTSDAKNQDARLILAGLLSTTYDNEGAIREYRTILKQDPGHEEAAVYLAQVYAEDHKEAQARTFLEGFVKQNPEAAVAWYYLGRGYQRAGSNQKAAEAYGKALMVRKDFNQAGLALGVLLESTGQVEDAKKVYQKLYEELSDLSAASRLAALYIQEENYKAAIPYLELAVKEEPNDLNSKVKLGLVYMELDQLDQSEKVFKELKDAFPSSDRVNYYLGHLEEQKGALAEAVEYFKVLGVESDLYKDATLHAAYLLRQIKRVDDAVALLKKATDAVPTEPDFFLFLASLEEEKGDIKGAIDVLLGGVKHHPQNSRIQYYLGSLYDRVGQTSEALQRMEKVLALDPDHADALNYVGYTWTAQGVRLDDAETFLTKAVSLKPNNGFIQDSWGYHLLQRGRVSEAVVELEKAAKLEPKEAIILEHLGDAYLKANLYSKAHEQYEEALQVAQDSNIRSSLERKIQAMATRQHRLQSVREAERIPAEAMKTGALDQ